MRILCCVVLLALSCTGCKKSDGSVGDVGVSPGRTNYVSSLTGTVELADRATAERIVNIIGPYIVGPNYRLRDPEIVNVARPRKTTRNGKEADAVYVQFYAINNLADEEQHQHDLFIIQGDQVLEHFRTRDEITARMSETWYRNNPPPGWKLIGLRKGQ